MPKTFTLFLCLAALSAATANAQVITAVAGEGEQSYNGDGGPATAAWLAMPTGIAFDGAGNLYFADTGNRVVRKINTSGIISTYAGNEMLFYGNNGDGGPATNALFGWNGGEQFVGLAVDGAGNLYVSDNSSGIYRVRKVNASGIISTYAGGQVGDGGDGGPATSAGLMTAAGLAVDSQGNLYIADTLGERIRKVNTAGTISTVAGTGVAGHSGDGGPAVSATLSVPISVAVDAQGNLYIAESGNVLYGPRVRKVDTAGNISTIAGNGASGFSGDGGPALNAEFSLGIQGVAVDKAGNVYIADYNNYKIREVNASGTITTIAGANQPGGGGNGDGGLASNSQVEPSGMTVDTSGNVYFSDYFSSQIRKITFGATPPGLSASAASLYFAAVAANNVTPQPQEVTVSTTGPAISFTTSATTTSGGAWLNTSGTSGSTPGTTQVSINVSPTGTQLPAGTYSGTLKFTPTTPGYSPITVAVTLVLSATVPTAPSITGVVNGASFAAGQSIASNTFVTIQGTNLSTATNTWDSSITGGALPTSLSGVTVSFSDAPAYVSYVSPTQINVLAPSGSLGSALVQVNNNGALSSTMTVGLAPESPAFFTLSGNQAVATRQDYTYAVKNGTIPGLTTTPAAPGDVLILWGTGFGSTNPVTLPGSVTPSDTTYSTGQAVTVTINNVPATVYGAALAPGFAGLYQVAIQVPESLSSGDWQLIATTQDGFASPSGVILTVQN